MTEPNNLSTNMNPQDFDTQLDRVLDDISFREATFNSINWTQKAAAKKLWQDDRRLGIIQIKHLIVQRIGNELDKLRPPTGNPLYLTQTHNYLGKDYSCCSICGFSPDVMNAHIDELRQALNLEVKSP